MGPIVIFAGYDFADQFAQRGYLADSVVRAAQIRQVAVVRESDALHRHLDAGRGYDVRNRLVMPNDMSERVEHDDVAVPGIVRFSDYVIRDNQVLGAFAGHGSSHRCERAGRFADDEFAARLIIIRQRAAVRLLHAHRVAIIRPRPQANDGDDMLGGRRFAQRGSELAGEVVFILHRHPRGRGQGDADERNLPVILADCGGMGGYGRDGIRTSQRQRDDGDCSGDYCGQAAKSGDGRFHNSNFLPLVYAGGLGYALLFYKTAPPETNAGGGWLLTQRRGGAEKRREGEGRISANLPLVACRGDHRRRCCPRADGTATRAIPNAQARPRLIEG